MDVAYPFILDVQGYPIQVISLFVVIVCVLPLPLSCIKTFSGPLLDALEEARHPQAIQGYVNFVAKGNWG